MAHREWSGTALHTIGSASRMARRRALIIALALVASLGWLTTTVLYGQDAREPLFIDKDGRVGIGTSLDVAGPAAVSGSLGVGGATSVGGTLGVGGAASVGGTLDVAGATTLQGPVSVAGKNDTPGQVSLRLRSGNTAANFQSTQVTFGFTNTDDYRHAIKTRHNNAQDDGNAIDFYVWKFGKQAKDLADQPAMTLNGGKVGIGTTSPKAMLDVVGPGGETVELQVTGRLKSKSANGGLWLSDRDDAFVGNNDKNVGFWTSAREWNAFQIEKATGNVGINTQTPKFPLDVDGWIGSGTSTQVLGGWRLGKWPTLNPNEWVYLTRSDRNDGTGANYQGLAVGNLYVQGQLILQNKSLAFVESSFVKNKYNVEANDWSDERLKRDVLEIGSAREKIRALRGVTFHWNDEALRYFTSDIEQTIAGPPGATAEDKRELWRKERESRYAELAKTNVGIVAQDVEKILPEAVETDEKGYKQVKYRYLIPLLIEAVKEQDKALDAQASLLAQQAAQIDRLTALQRDVETQLAELAAVKARVMEVEANLERVTATHTVLSPEAMVRR